MHIYAFGSVCRGDIDTNSDIDLLAIVSGFDTRFDPQIYSIYSRKRIEEIWAEGNPFAWHLSGESRLLFSSDGSNLLSTMGTPNRYSACRRDCEKFHQLFVDAQSSINSSNTTAIFDLSTTFLAVRNFATCFSLGQTDAPVFSRHAALSLADQSLPISDVGYRVLERARILCTRGHGTSIAGAEVATALREFPVIEKWMAALLSEVYRHES